MRTTGACGRDRANPDGSLSVASAPSAAIAGAPPFNTTLPAVSGTPRVGAVVSTSTGNWSPAGASFDYQWQHTGSAGSFTDISGAKAPATRRAGGRRRNRQGAGDRDQRRRLGNRRQRSDRDDRSASELHQTPGGALGHADEQLQADGRSRRLGYAKRHLQLQLAALPRGRHRRRLELHADRLRCHTHAEHRRHRLSNRGCRHRHVDRRHVRPGLQRAQRRCRRTAADQSQPSRHQRYPSGPAGAECESRQLEPCAVIGQLRMATLRSRRLLELHAGRLRQLQLRLERSRPQPHDRAARERHLARAHRRRVEPRADDRGPATPAGRPSRRRSAEPPSAPAP